MQGEKEKRLSYMKCANCGTELKDGTLFCPVCKSEIQWVPEYHTLETILLQKQMREKNLKEKKQKKEEELRQKKRQEEIAKKYPSVSYKIAEEIEAKTGMEIRVTVPGHMQRGGSPCPYDRVLSTRLGSEAAQLILDKQYGYMVGMVNGKVKKIPLGECAGKLKTVDPNAQEVLQAKRMGISFGD